MIAESISSGLHVYTIAPKRVKKNKDYLISDTVIFNTKTKNLKFSMKDKTKKVYGKKTKN